jgi:hypothetical protein
MSSFGARAWCFRNVAPSHTHVDPGFAFNGWKSPSPTPENATAHGFPRRVVCVLQPTHSYSPQLRLRAARRVGMSSCDCCAFYLLSDFMLVLRQPLCCCGVHIIFNDQQSFGHVPAALARSNVVLSISHVPALARMRCDGQQPPFACYCPVIQWISLHSIHCDKCLQQHHHLHRRWICLCRARCF